MAELNKKSLGDRIKSLRLSFQKPYYFFSLMENGNRMLIFEDEEGKELTFREKNLIGCVTKAEDHLKAMEIRSGQEAKLKEQQEQKQEGAQVNTPPSPEATVPPPSQPTPLKEERDIEIKTTVIDDKGKEHKEF